MKEGTVIVFGSVANPKGAFGVGVAQLGDGAEANASGANDPTMPAGAGCALEICPMPRAAWRK